MRRRGAAAMTFALAGTLAGSSSCTAEGAADELRESGAGAEGAHVVVDGRGVSLSSAEVRTRVVSLVPSMTETLLAFGAAPALVGRTRFDGDPRIAHVPSVGGSVNPDLESIVGARPDLVVTWADEDARALAERLESLGLPVYAARSRSVADFERHALALGRLLHRQEAATEMVGDVRRRIEHLRVDVGEEERPRVLFVVWPRPLMTTGRHTFVAELIRAVGGRGAFEDVNDPWPTVSFEAVLERNPEVIVVAGERPSSEVPDWMASDARWQTIDALREDRVHVVDGDRFNRPGPGMADAAEELARYVRAASRRRRP